MIKELNNNNNSSHLSNVDDDVNQWFEFSFVSIWKNSNHTKKRIMYAKNQEYVQPEIEQLSKGEIYNDSHDIGNNNMNDGFSYQIFYTIMEIMMIIVIIVECMMIQKIIII